MSSPATHTTPGPPISAVEASPTTAEIQGVCFLGLLTSAIYSQVLYVRSLNISQTWTPTSAVHASLISAKIQEIHESYLKLLTSGIYSQVLYVRSLNIHQT